MAQKRKAKTTKTAAIARTNGESGEAVLPRSLRIASEGVHSGRQFASLMSDMMLDLIDGRITPSVGNAVCNAGSKLLKVVEMQQRWGKQSAEGGERDLALTGNVAPRSDG